MQLLLLIDNLKERAQNFKFKTKLVLNLNKNNVPNYNRRIGYSKLCI